MTRRIYALAAMLLLIMVTEGCCHKHEPERAFLESSVLSLRINGCEIVRYEPETFQTGFSPENKQFRIHNDTMSEFFTLTCQELPEEKGQKIKCSLRYCADGEVVYQKGLSFNVEKIGDDGTVWLWCSKKKTGATVRILK